MPAIRSGCVALLLLCTTPAAIAQQSPRATTENAPTPPSRIAQVPGGGRHWTTIEIVISVGVLVFGALIFALQTFLMIRLPLAWTPAAILRFNGLTLIIVAGVLLVTAGYSNQQMAPVIGLLGAIAGYLLGTGEKPGRPPGN